MPRSNTPIVSLLLGVPWLVFFCPNVGAQQPVFDDIDGFPPVSTYERFVPLAEAGDPQAQHLLGYMFFYGEGVELDLDKAHDWFHLAAEENELKSMRSLGLFHANGVPGIPANFYDPREANLWFSLAVANATDSSLAIADYRYSPAPEVDDLLKSTLYERVGESIYFAYCAGCHGFEGYSSLPHAPSFALGEGLQKSDSLLITNFRRALDPWPHPVSDIPRDALFATLAYIRAELRKTISPARSSTGLLVTTPPPERVDRAQVGLGEQIYLQFCGGCHGFNGISAYVPSPSFALDERMHRSDAQLTSSIRHGRGEMPSWEFMLNLPQIEALVAFIRTFEESYAKGISYSPRPYPQQFFRFTPKSRLGPGQMHNLPTAD